MKVKLKDICEIQSGGTPNRSNKQYWDNGTINWAKISDIKDKYLFNTEEKITEEGLKNSTAKLFKKNSILYTIFATLGEACILGIDTTTNQAIANLEIRDKNVETEYIYYYLLSKKKLISGIGRGVAQNNINLSILKEMEINLADITTQKRIVDILNQNESIINKYKKQIALLDTLIKARFVEMFGDVLLNDKCFDVKRLSKLASLITKGASPNWQGFQYVDDKSQTLFITSENVKNGYLDLSNSRYVSDEYNIKQSRSMLEKGDFLINIVGASIGRAAIYDLDIKANMNQASALVRLKEGLINEMYLNYYLNSEKALAMYNSMKSDTGRANLSLNNIGNLSIIIPPIELQNKFATFVKHIDKLKVA